MFRAGKLLFFAFFSLVLVNLCQATHNRAGEITYVWNYGYTYTITIVTYTNSASSADRCQLGIYFGDGDSCVAGRTNGPIGGCAPFGMGDIIPGAYNMKVNYYSCQHTYHGPGKYWISMSDANRNAGIDNIQNSVNVVFCIQTLLVINPFLGSGHVDSPVFLNPPIDNGCLYKCYYHNPLAFDPDGDSLAFKLGTPLESEGVPVSGYALPPTTGGGYVSLNVYNGDFIWCTPPNPPNPYASNFLNPGVGAPGVPISEYNIVIIVEAWRSGYLVAEVERDMQINIFPCDDNPPVIQPLKDTCVVAGDSVSFKVIASDPSAGHSITLSAVGGPLTLFYVKPKAIFPTVGPKANADTSTFKWKTACSNIRKQPYVVSFKAVNTDPFDPNFISLAIFKTMNITVVAPAPKNVNAKPSGSSMHVTWSGDTCSNNLYSYLIYRSDSCINWKHDPCQTGLPSTSGYTYIGSSDSTSFIDDNNGKGLIRGLDYSYIVVAEYTDGSESYASTQACAKLTRDVPILTNVDVIVTNPVSGQIKIKWIPPKTDSTDFDSTKFIGPYQYVLMHDTGFGTSFVPVKTFSAPFFALLAPDTAYLDTGLNTTIHPYNYRLDFYAGGGSIKIGSTDNASSVYLSITPAIPGNKLNLSWSEQVPWTNSMYTIFKETGVSGNYSILGQTSASVFSDSNLVNNHSYCYKVESSGAYSDTSIPHPLYNHSEIKCAVPTDKQAPCAPILNVTGNCYALTDSMVWTDPDHMNCRTNDVVEYKVYFTPVEGQPYHLLYDTKTVFGIYATADTSFLKDSLTSIAGCYVVTALDSSGNESVYSNQVCIDNCPVYALPNVFSPNGDGINDYYKAFPYRFVKSINLEIFDRWGLIMYKATDPDFRWDGKNKDSGKQCPDGIYYYICTVNEIHYEGIIPHELKGFLQIMSKKGDPPIH